MFRVDRNDDDNAQIAQKEVTRKPKDELVADWQKVMASQVVSESVVQQQDNDVQVSFLDEDVSNLIHNFVDKVNDLSVKDTNNIKELANSYFADENKLIANEGLWSAFNKAKSLDGGNAELASTLKSVIMDDFIKDLKHNPPIDKDELVDRLKDEFRLNTRREQVLWESWAQLKDEPGMDATVDDIRSALSTSIIINGLVKNMLEHGMKPEME